MTDIVFKEKYTSENKKKLNLKARGRSGTFVSSNVIQNDYLTELNGVEGQELFAKILLSDSQIRKLYHSVSNPIRSANWDIEPASDDQKDLDAAALIKHILFNDIPDGFKSKLSEILTFPWHGHCVLEIINKNRFHKTFGAYSGLANLSFRDQRTLNEWVFSKEGILEKIHQIQSGDIEVDQYMDADTL